MKNRNLPTKNNKFLDFLMTKQIITTSRFWLIGLVLFLAGTATHAGVIVEGNTAVGITALDIGLPDLYDITFEAVTGSMGNPITLEPCVVLGPSCDLFGGDQSGALAAAGAIRTALMAGADSVGLPGGGYSETSFRVPYNDACTNSGDPCIDVYETPYNIIWLNPQETFIFTEPDIQSSVIFARFQPASQVPLPPAAYLFASGIVGLIGMARRRRPLCV